MTIDAYRQLTLRHPHLIPSADSKELRRERKYFTEEGRGEMKSPQTLNNERSAGNNRCPLPILVNVTRRVIVQKDRVRGSQTNAFWYRLLDPLIVVVVRWYSRLEEWLRW
jgi:hypothetical protein